VVAEFVASEGSTSENVRNGISNGAGMVMDSGLYNIVFNNFTVDTALKEYSLTINLADYIPDFEPIDGRGSETIFLVIEDSQGNLSQLYTIN